MSKAINKDYLLRQLENFNDEIIAEYYLDNATFLAYASGVSSALNNKQNSTLSSAITVDGVSKSTVEDALSAINTLAASKTSNTGTVTSVSAGVGLTTASGSAVSTTGTVKAKLKSETALTNDSTAATEVANRVYPVAVDKSGYLAVNVPWSSTGADVVSTTEDGLAPQITNTNGFLKGNGTWAVPDDTKNTAGSTNSSNKLFLIGATSQTASSQTYSDDEVYVTSGVLTTKKVQVGGTAVTLEVNSVNQCLDFIFS